jgi:nicotinamidase-related amidase
VDDAPGIRPIPARSGGMRLSPALRSALREHFGQLRREYEARGWGGRVGFGNRPAVLVIDLALGWTRPEGSLGSDLDSVVEATVEILAAARRAGVPIFFTTGLHDPAEPARPAQKKFVYPSKTNFGDEFSLDPRLGRRPDEKLIAKPFASTFKGTHFGQMLAALGVDTLIVTGCSTGHCVYATCRDALEYCHVIVPREAVGDRSELMHEVNLFDIDISMGDVVATAEVVAWLAGRGAMREGGEPSPQ